MNQEELASFNAAVTAFNAGRAAEALAHLDEIVVPPINSPGYSVVAENVFFLRGAATAALGVVQIAAKNFRGAYDLNPRRVDICERFGDLLLSTGDLVEGMYFKNKARELRRFQNNEDVAVIGDSHADYLFSGIPRCKIRWIGPVTMHRVARDGTDVLGLDSLDFKKLTKIVLCFGEIDARAHVGRIAVRSGIAPEEVIENLCWRYFNSVESIVAKYPDISLALVSIIPAFQLHPSLYPSLETVAVRGRHIKAMNTRLAAGCAERGWKFLNVSKYLSSPSGAMYVEYSDGNVHLRRTFSDVANYEMCLAFDH